MNCQLGLINFRETPDEALFLTYLVSGKVKTSKRLLTVSYGHSVAAHITPTEPLQREQSLPGLWGFTVFY
jgi:hypothetical protein